MEQQKNNHSDSSTAESDHKNQPAKSNDGGVARSYDCAFCKRGFTNAQALGGHMNIHRKDTAKAKKKKKAKQGNHEYSSTYSTANYGDESFGEHVNYRVYIPSPNPGLQRGNYEYCFFPIWRPGNLEDCVNGNLSLRMGSGEDEEDGVDLELRLGRLM